ncbi:MAG: hypothetical protein N2745_05370 [Syntrophorhabdaceae bacterium]|nr:hypothetical protein [Syntrophorhabdaceae bacterium]
MKVSSKEGRGAEAKEFKELLKEMEKQALKMIKDAKEPNAAAMEIIREIKRVLERIEAEGKIGEVASTEAHVVGVGVGVI